MTTAEMEENRCSDFSIEHILNRAGNCCERTSQVKSENSQVINTFSWLNCTRYCPPKIPRVQRRDGPQKRQLGRHPRIPFTSHQLSILEEKFQQSPYLSNEEVINLSRKLQLADIRVKIWFQNRRARERREKMHNSETKQSPETDQIVIKEENVAAAPTISEQSHTSTDLCLSFLPQTLILPPPFHHFPTVNSFSHMRMLDPDFLLNNK